MKSRLTFTPLALGLGLIILAPSLSLAAPRRSAKATKAAAAPSSTTDSSPVSATAFDAELDRLQTQVPELRFIRERAQALGIRVWLFGGTAAGLGHYARWNLQHRAGDKSYQRERFDDDYTSIYRSTQDADVVVDGPLAQAEQLERELQAKFPHLQGNKSAWEVRLLNQQRGDKFPLLNNPDFAHQHTDTNSVGMIELTPPPSGETRIRDLRHWKAPHPPFLDDLLNGTNHFLFSPRHSTTRFFLDGRNPPIFSVVRFLTKAFQYDLAIRPEDRALIKKIIAAYSPNEVTENSQAASWLEKNGKKLFANAIDIERAWQELESLGLRQKLIASSDHSPDAEGSLAWWLSKHPLATQPLGTEGRTARELKLDRLAHETSNFLAYENITLSRKGDPNVFISRGGTTGEAAIHGDGFYTRIGDQGARGTGFTIRFHLDPDAREGTDFELVGEDFVLVHNRRAIRVIPEELHLGPVEWLEMLAHGRNFEQDDRGIQEKIRRRVAANLHNLTAQQSAQISKIARAAIANPARGGFVIDELVRLDTLLTPEPSSGLPKSVVLPEIPAAVQTLASFLDSSDDFARTRIATELLLEWLRKAAPGQKISAIRGILKLDVGMKASALGLLAEHFFAKPEGSAYLPELATLLFRLSARENGSSNTLKTLIQRIFEPEGGHSPAARAAVVSELKKVAARLEAKDLPKMRRLVSDLAWPGPRTAWAEAGITIEVAGPLVERMVDYADSAPIAEKKIAFEIMNAWLNISEAKSAKAANRKIIDFVVANQAPLGVSSLETYLAGSAVKDNPDTCAYLIQAMQKSPAGERDLLRMAQLLPGSVTTRTEDETRRIAELLAPYIEKYFLRQLNTWSVLSSFAIGAIQLPGGPNYSQARSALIARIIEKVESPSFGREHEYESFQIAKFLAEALESGKAPLQPGDLERVASFAAGAQRPDLARRLIPNYPLPRGTSLELPPRIRYYGTRVAEFLEAREKGYLGRKFSEGEMIATQFTGFEGIAHELHEAGFTLSEIGAAGARLTWRNGHQEGYFREALALATTPKQADEVFSRIMESPHLSPQDARWLKSLVTERKRAIAATEAAAKNCLASALRTP